MRTGRLPWFTRSTARHFRMQPSPGARRQWLAELPAGKRALLEAQDGAVFLEFLAALDAVLGMQALPLEEWRAQHSSAQGENELGQEQATGLASLTTAVDSCSEILKGTASLLSLDT